MAWASTIPRSGKPASSAGTAWGMRALSPRAEILKVIASGGPSPSTATIPPRGIDWAATRIMFSRSLTRFFGKSALDKFQDSLILSSSMKPRATFSASPRSTWAVAEPAAPNASRQNCSRADAVLALFLMRSRAKLLVSSSVDSSSTSSPFTIAPDGLIRSWQTREHNSAARSRASSVTGTDIEIPLLRRVTYWTDAAALLLQQGRRPGRRHPLPNQLYLLDKFRPAYRH